jgi:hypothetical protein
MPRNRKRRPAGDRAALGVFDNNSSNAPRFNPGTAPSQEAAEFERLAELRFRANVERLHRRPRALYEMLLKLGASRLIRTEIERQVERHAALDPHIVCAVGGDRFAGAPIHLVPP